MVYNAAWSSTVINPDPPGAETRPFDFRIPLETPYFYNPAEGNLLFDNIFEMPGSGNGLARFDLDSSNVFSEKRNITSGPLGDDSPVSTDGRFTSINEFAFIPNFIPEPSTYAVTALAFLAVVCRVRTRRV